MNSQSSERYPTLRILRDPQAGAEHLRRLRQPLTSAQLPGGLKADLEARFGPGATAVTAVEAIVADVAEGGEAALRRWTIELDGEAPERFTLGKEDMRSALDRLDRELRDSMVLARDRIRRFHKWEPVASWSTDELGGVLGQRLLPIQRIGIYVPGGTAPLPSSLLMAAIPAQVAGVPEVVVATPPAAPDSVLAAASLCGVDEILQAGGAQAIAALAFGTESFRPVDKVVGAGGLFVTLAKRAVYGVVGLDGLYGPTETLLIADDGADPVKLAADLLAQAEHDPLATALLITVSEEVAREVQDQVDLQLQRLDRQETIRRSLEGQGAIILAPDLARAAHLANDYAPEHLCLSVSDPGELLETINNAGGIFLGESSCEVLGDYVAGPSHVMPTGGSARFAGPLSVRDFLKVSSLIDLDQRTVQELAPAAARLARAEGLTGHAAAAELRAGGQHD